MNHRNKLLKRIDSYWENWSWENWAIIFIFAFAFGEMAWLSVRRVLGLNALWFDLGAITQAINSVLFGKFLESTDSLLFLNSIRLAGHAEVIYFLFAPLLLIYRSPVILLVAQSFLYATGGIAFFLIGKNLKNKTLGIWLSIFYLWYPIAQSAVLFDFHGDTIAMPILAWALYAFTIRNWKSYYILIIFALLCKVYVAVPVGLLGLILYRMKFKKQGIITILIALTWSLFATVVLKSWFSVAPTVDAPNYFLLRIPSNIENFFNPIRLITLIIILIPIIPYLRKASLWFIPALGIAIPAFLFSGYEYYFHHYALAVPFIVYSIGDEYQKSKKKEPDKKAIALLMLLSSLVLNFMFIIYLGPGQFITNNTPTNGPERSLLLIPWINEEVPADATITASPNLSPFLSMRPVIYQTFLMQNQLDEPVDLITAGSRSEYFVIDSFFENDKIALLYIEEDVLKWVTQPNSGFKLQKARDGIFIFTNKDIKPIITAEEYDSFSPITESVSMENGLSLEDVELDAIFTNNEWQFRFSYIWDRVSDNPIPHWYAITSLMGYPASRAFHLDSWVIEPVSELGRNDSVQEFVYLNLPHIPGCYPVSVGWYDPLLPIIAGEESAIQGKNFIWGYWQMGEQFGEGTLVDHCKVDTKK